MFSLFKRHKKDPKKALKKMLQGYELPTFPQTAMNALRKLRDPDAPLKEVAKEIEKDPGMHVMVLKCVNSAAFGLSRKVSNALHAANLLGKARLESLILPLAVKESLPKIKVSCMDTENFWRTSAFRASLARSIADEIHPISKHDSFTAALLQDIAIPVLLRCKKDDYCAILNQWNEEEGARLPMLEKDTYGFDHQTLGALMGEEWEFPENLIHSILYHHEHYADKDVPIAVRLVSGIRYLNGQDVYESLEKLKDVCINEHGIRPSIVEAGIEKALEDADELARLFA